MAISTVSVTSGRKEAELLDLPPSYYQLFEPLPPPYSSVQDLTYDPDSPSSSKLQLPSAPPYTAIDENSDHHGDYGDQSGTPIRQPLTSSSTSQNGNRRSRSDSTAILIPGSGPGSDEYEPDLNPSDVLNRVRSESRDTRGNNSRRSGSGSRSQSRSNGNGTRSGSGSGSGSGSRNSNGNGNGSTGTDSAGATAAGLKASCCKHFCTIMAGLAVFAFIVCVIQWLYVKSEKKRSGYDFDTSNFHYPELNFNPSNTPNQEIQIPFSKINYDDFFANWKASQNVNKEKELYFNQFND